MDMTLRISRSVIDAIVVQAGNSRDEICGLLLGSDRRIASHVPARNVHATPRTRFELDPAVLFRAMKAARGGGRAILGYYHSHPGPGGVAKPSVVDAAAADPDGALWMIVGRADVRVWRAVSDGAVHGRFDPVPYAADPPCA